MRIVNPFIAQATHSRTKNGRTIFEKQLDYGGYRDLTVVGPSEDRQGLLPPLEVWKSHLNAITGLREGQPDADGRCKLERLPFDPDDDPLAAGSQIVVHRLDYTLSIDTHGAAGLTRFYWPDGKDKIDLDALRPKPLGAEIAGYAIWLLSTAYRPFEISQREMDEEHLTLLVA